MARAPPHRVHAGPTTRKGRRRRPTCALPLPTDCPTPSAAPRWLFAGAGPGAAFLVCLAPQDRGLQLGSARPKRRVHEGRPHNVLVAPLTHIVAPCTVQRIVATFRRSLRHRITDTGGSEPPDTLPCPPSDILPPSRGTLTVFFSPPNPLPPHIAVISAAAIMFVFVLVSAAAKGGSRPSGSRCPTGWTGEPPVDHPVRHAHTEQLASHAGRFTRHASRPRPRHRRPAAKATGGVGAKAPRVVPPVVSTPLPSRIRVALARVLHR